MTDNRTTELLREGLTEHGIEWRGGLKGVTFVGDWCFVEYDHGKLAATCEPVLTPEQAIAATLGSEKFYAVKTWTDLDDRGESHIERKLYRTREEAERRAEEVEAFSSDEMGYYAMVVEFEVVG